MELGSRAVERMLAASFGIGEDRLMAFRGRLDHLRRLGCPTGVNTGKGKPATFGWSQLIELSVALALVDVGASPEHTASFIRNNTSTINVSAAGMLIEAEDAFHAVSVGKWEATRTTYLNVSMHALAGLRDGGSVESAGVGFFSGITGMVEWFVDAPAAASSVVIIDLGAKLAELVWLVVAWSDTSVEEVFDDLVKWSDEVAEALVAGGEDGNT